MAMPNYDEGKLLVKACFSLWRYKVSRGEFVLFVLEELGCASYLAEIFHGLWTKAASRYGDIATNDPDFEGVNWLKVWKP
jgi:hypothetical protein